MPDLTALPERNQIPQEHTWNVQSIFPSDQEWSDACQEIVAQIPHLRSFRGRLGESPATLLSWFTSRDHIYQLRDQVYFYAYARHVVDTTDQDAAALLGRARSLTARLYAATSFARTELAEIGAERLRGWMEEKLELAGFKHFFDRLENMRPHLRSPEAEELLALASDPFSTAASTARLMMNADLTFAPAADSEGVEMEVAQGTIRKLLTSHDRDLRRIAWENYSDGYLAFRNTLANCLTAAIKQNVFRMRVRNYASSLESVLAPNNIPVRVFHNLLDVFKKNLPTWHRYWRVRRQALGYESLHEYDIFAPLTDNTPRISYKQAVDWLAEGMRPLGDEYVNVLRAGALERRWVDIYPNKGKRDGAFSNGAAGVHPFIFTSHTDDLLSLSTLAHEFGHAMHSYYTWQAQPYVYSHYSLFVAEVASNFNQALLRAHLSKTNSDPLFQIALIEEALKNFHRYFFIMPTLARFELETHERVEQSKPLTAGIMIELMADLFEEGYGDQLVMDRERTGITWAQFGHLYTSFYVFQYATGISGAHALAEGVLSGEPGAAERYLEFLKAGASLYPLEALKLAGVDLTTPEPVEKAFEVLSGYVDQLEHLVGATTSQST